ncbi:PREDICTED: glycerol-3-phosphate acyltransferase 4 isoform X1 [Papilio xuthus]|uniref:Glycerol-3-phosphate acyltransferase 4 isoform X1 n=1 Tax=Papilio xuthus TaxID=66420 RepID=A0AAJ6ZKG0_PAPXU|nr:PREDICTED: glycerol-3-phosphate acyltransferase 4 isoform X1 [Papilio xuthus]
MALIMPFVSVAVSILYTPFLLFILCIIFLASIGKSLGVRRLYVNILLKLFEYGRQHIEVAKKLQRSDSSDEEEPLVPDDKPPSAIIKENGVNGTKTTVIERQEILGPSPELNYRRVQNGHKAEQGNGETNLEFHFYHCMDLVKAGMESIIEDQVTSVFEAEELRSWNLLTRTNRQYEFLTWRLTIIWMMGFVVRYFFLLPLRILIFVIGVLTLLWTMLLVSTLPTKRLRRFFGAISYKISMRILMRSLSCVVFYHDVQHLPKEKGFCVANHTSPIDVIILSYNSYFSLVWWLIISTACVGTLPDGPFKQRVNHAMSIMSFNFLSRCISMVITYHDGDINRPKNGICVANHTSPIDVLVLMCDNCYSLIGQRHDGFLGLLQRALARASPHIWFERSEVKDRHAVARRLKEHISVPDNPPILIFPEGTCINNTSVMQFKKGSFEVGGTIYPVAIKYDPRFGDAFWNSSRYGMLHYLLNMMSSWAIVCDVWYLPPMHRYNNETAVDFANRVKAVVARRGGLVDLMWDGQLKRMKAKKEWRELQQEEFSKRLKGE